MAAVVTITLADARRAILADHDAYAALCAHLNLTEHWNAGQTTESVAQGAGGQVVGLIVRLEQMIEMTKQTGNKAPLREFVKTFGSAAALRVAQKFVRKNPGGSTITEVREAFFQPEALKMVAILAKAHGLQME